MLRGGAELDASGHSFKPSAWVFSIVNHFRPIDGHAATRAVLRAREDLIALGVAPFNTHDLRRTISTHLGEMDVLDEIIERILNHAPRTVAGKHYNHARYLGPMKIALDAWAARLATIVGEPP